MSETTVATPLSGEEIIDATLDTIGRGLRKDGHLNPALAYEAFELEVFIRLKLRDNGRFPEIERRTLVAQNASLFIEEGPFVFRLILEERPPNRVREEAGLGIPTLIEDANGKKELRSVRYQTPRGATVERPTEAPPQPVEKPVEKPPAGKPAVPPKTEPPEDAGRTRVVR